ncbi:hypothetical protein A4X06_0g4685 [Tilletia controversa]|uniref:Shq1 protein domain-containing protein n=1 Tax=Tilletia controversa TaxID=13291 RepID=A0A8X7MS36_9BASI|nr:hypothetical protein CF328_g4541 [Tilletia controversa]KAE8247126.1 hypothetical protein A4X06_0g4685 [Tilletia controversa]
MATSPSATTTVPSYNLSQDDHTIQVRIHCPLAPPNSQPNVVSDGQIFGFTCPKMGRSPYYLPLYLPMPVHSPTLVRDPATSALIVTLRKTQPGVHIPELSLLQPSLHPDLPFIPEMMDSGATTPVSSPDTLDNRQSYLGIDAAMLMADASQMNSRAANSPALSPPMGAHSGAFIESAGSEDVEVRQAADELIALGIKNENERRQAHGQDPLVFTAEDASDVNNEQSGSFSHKQHSSEASTTSSALSAADDDDDDQSSAAAKDAGVRDAIAAAARVASSPSPGKIHPYGFRGAFTGPFLPSSSNISLAAASVTGSAGSTVESASGNASHHPVRSRVHELQQDVRRLAWGRRRKVAKLCEEEKWDEGRYLDGYVDEFGEVSEILAWVPEDRPGPSAAYLALTNQSEAEEAPSLKPFDKTAREAHLAALQFLFAYGYDWRTTQGEHSVESDWTLSVLCRSLVTQCPIEPASTVVPRATSPSGSISTPAISTSSADLSSGAIPRAVSPASSMTGTPGFAHQPLDGAMFANTVMSGTPILRGASPDPVGSFASTSVGASAPISIAGTAGIGAGGFGSSGAIATLGRRPGSSESVGSPPGMAGLASPPMSTSISGSLAAPHRSSGLSVTGTAPGGMEYGSGGGVVTTSSVPVPLLISTCGGAGVRGKMPKIRDEPEYDTPLSILRASYRRALTFPLHRSWALCDKVRDDVLVLLRAGLKDTCAALGDMEERLMSAEDVVMHRYAEVWVQPVREWLEKNGSDHSLALLTAQIEAVSSDLTRDLVGGEMWDLELLEAAARDALDEGHGGYG